MSSRKKAQKNRVKAPKRRRVVMGLIAGKSMRRAALDAGYSKPMADKAGEKILPGVIDEFKEALAKTVPQGKLIQRIAEGLDAKETRLVQFDGEYTDSRNLVDYSERRRYVELAAKLMGFLTERVHLSGIPEPPVEFHMQVNFVDPEDPETEEESPRVLTGAAASLVDLSEPARGEGQ